MCFYQTFFGLRWKQHWMKKVSVKCKMYTNCIVWNRNSYKNWHSLWLSDSSSKHFIYKCKLDKYLPTLSCFQQLMLKYRIEEYNSKVSGEQHTFNLNWLCYKPFWQSESNNFSVNVVMLDFECIYVWHSINHSMCVMHGKYLSVKYFFPTVCLYVCTFCILCMPKLYIYIGICLLSIVETGVLTCFVVVSYLL